MLWIKSFHIIAMVAWFAGIFYLPRLYVYHAETTDQTSIERFKVMERRLYRGIMTPAAVVTLFLGCWLLSFNPGYYMHAGWMHTKLLLVLILLLYHFYCGHLRRQFYADKNTRSSLFFRVFNELPVFLLVGIVIMVIVRPYQPYTHPAAQAIGTLSA